MPKNVFYSHKTVSKYEIYSGEPLKAMGHSPLSIISLQRACAKPLVARYAKAIQEMWVCESCHDRRSFQMSSFDLSAIFDWHWLFTMFNGVSRVLEGGSWIVCVPTDFFWQGHQCMNGGPWWDKEVGFMTVFIHIPSFMSQGLSISNMGRLCVWVALLRFKAPKVKGVKDNQRVLIISVLSVIYLILKLTAHTYSYFVGFKKIGLKTRLRIIIKKHYRWCDGKKILF